MCHWMNWHPFQDRSPKGSMVKVGENGIIWPDRCDGVFGLESLPSSNPSEQ